MITETDLSLIASPLRVPEVWWSPSQGFIRRVEPLTPGGPAPLVFLDRRVGALSELPVDAIRLVPE